MLIFTSYFLQQMQHSFLLSKLNLKVRFFLFKTICLTCKITELAIVGDIYNACEIQQEMFIFYKTLCPTWLDRAYLKATRFCLKLFTIADLQTGFSIQDRVFYPRYIPPFQHMSSFSFFHSYIHILFHCQLINNQSL